MASKIVSALLFVLGSITICFGETNFRGLEAGRSTRAEVEKTLGPALRELSATLSEYKSEKEREKIYVQYGQESNVAHRIELLYSNPVERSVVIGTLNLPPTSTASQVNSKGRLEEYFSSNYV